MKKEEETPDLIIGRSFIKKNKPTLKVDETKKPILEFIQSLRNEKNKK
jgi:hypothetical protein